MRAIKFSELSRLPMLLSAVSMQVFIVILLKIVDSLFNIVRRTGRGVMISSFVALFPPSFTFVCRDGSVATSSVSGTSLVANKSRQLSV